MFEALSGDMLEFVIRFREASISCGADLDMVGLLKLWN